MPMSINVIGCRACRGVEEDNMAERKNEKRLGCIELFEYQRPDGTIDHRIDITGEVKGMEMRLGVTVDQVRGFFSKTSRPQQPVKKLKAVKD